MKAVNYFLFAMLFLTAPLMAQNSDELTTMNTLTIYYVDNSQTSVYPKINTEIAQSLRDRVSASIDDKQDFFLAFLSNGQMGKFSSNEKEFLERELPEFLDRKTRGSNYESDKQLFREFFMSQFPVKVKQTVEINFYLSAFAVYNLKNKIGDYPSPISLVSEIPVYLNNDEINIKVNYFITRPPDATMDKEFNVGSVTNLLEFYLSQISKHPVRAKVQFL